MFNSNIVYIRYGQQLGVVTNVISIPAAAFPVDVSVVGWSSPVVPAAQQTNYYLANIINQPNPNLFYQLTNIPTINPLLYTNSYYYNVHSTTQFVSQQTDTAAWLFDQTSEQTTGTSQTDHGQTYHYGGVTITEIEDNSARKRTINDDFGTLNKRKRTADQPRNDRRKNHVEHQQDEIGKQNVTIIVSQTENDDAVAVPSIVENDDGKQNMSDDLTNGKRQKITYDHDARIMDEIESYPTSSHEIPNGKRIIFDDEHVTIIGQTEIDAASLADDDAKKRSKKMSAYEKTIVEKDDNISSPDDDDGKRQKIMTDLDEKTAVGQTENDVTSLSEDDTMNRKG